METQFSEIWGRSMAYYNAHLSDRDRMRIETVKSQPELTAHARRLEKEYSAHRFVRCLRSTHLFVAQLRSFCMIINIFIQSNPDIAALIWGPLALILELAARHQDALELIGDIFERIERVLPRFQEYLKEFGLRELTGRLQEALITYYAEILGHYQDSIKFLRVRPLKNILLFNRPAAKFSLATNRRLSTLVEKTQWVEEEVGWVIYQVQKQRHNDVMNLLDSKTPAVMTVSKLPYRSLPYSRNNQFHYRDDLLDSLNTHLRPGLASSGLRVVSLHGLGGVGKTQVALEFCYRHSGSYDAIFWFKSESEAKLLGSITRQARDMHDDLESAPQEDATLVKSFQKWLTTATISGRRVVWLIVLDNVDAAHTIEKFWPTASQGSIIITSRNSEVARLYGHAIEVPIFSQNESLRFMFDINPWTDNTIDLEAAAAKAITERLGHLPLVLNHIGAYIRRTGSTYQNFLKFYEDFDTNLLFESQDSSSVSYETPIRNTWTMTFKTITREARILMETIALLDIDGVPIELFEVSDKSAKMCNGPSDEFPHLDECLVVRYPNRQKTDRAISDLLAGCLIARNPVDNRLSCHRMVREAILQSLAPETMEIHFDWAVFALNACFPTTLAGRLLLNDWSTCAVFHSQISALLGIYNRFSHQLRPPVLLCEVMRRCAWYLFERANHSAAKEMIEQGNKILAVATQSNNHPGYYPRYMVRLTADLYSTIGSIEYELNLPGHGRAWLEKGRQHRGMLIEQDTAESWDIEAIGVADSNISLAYLANGIPDPSIATHTLLIRTFDTSSYRSIWAANLSIAYRVKGSLGDSLEWCQTATKWTASADREDGLLMAFVHFSTGCTLLAMKKHEEALRHFESCLKIRQQRSPTHAYTAFVCHRIGALLRARGDLIRATAFFRRSVDVLRNCQFHQCAGARSKYALSKTLEETGELDEAEGLLKEVQDELKHAGHTVESDGLEETLEQFVLYCHR